MARKVRLPIVTIGGFLGAGKTSLVNALLAQANGTRLVVFVNDFGAINIDHAMIETVEQDRISLKNGCVCCSLNEDLVASVNQFATSPSPPDAILIEASGVADPRALDSSFALLEASGSAIVDTRIYVVDADGFGGLNYEDSETIIDHAAAADLVLLNKCDLAGETKLASLNTLFEESAPYSGLVHTRHCSVSLKLILSRRNGAPTRNQDHPVTDASPIHDTEYAQWSGETDTPIDRKKFLAFAEELPKYCLRSKGFLRFSDAPDELICFNLVGVRASYEKLDALREAPSQLVAIGARGKMNSTFFANGFKSLQCAP